MYRNVASQSVSAQLISKTSGEPITTGTTTVYVTKAAGTQGQGSGTVAHEGNGEWSYQPSQTETDAGHVAFTFVNSDAINVTVNVYPVVLNDYADALLKRDWTSVTGEAARSVLNALRFLRNKWGITGTETKTLTVTKEDDSTTAWTSTLSTSDSVDPVTASDPD